MSRRLTINFIGRFLVTLSMVAAGAFLLTAILNIDFSNLSVVEHLGVILGVGLIFLSDLPFRLWGIGNGQ